MVNKEQYKGSPQSIALSLLIGIKQPDMSTSEISKRLTEAYKHSRRVVIAWLIHIGDIQRGLGQRELFKNAFRTFATDCDIKTAMKLVSYIPKFGRWDLISDIACDEMCPEEVRNTTIQIIKEQLEKDVEYATKDDTDKISLLAKWLPSSNTSSEKTRRKAYLIHSALGLKESEYRKMMSNLRKKLQVTEVLMSANEWDKIDYSNVPRVANYKYNRAFLNHDRDRRLEYLKTVDKDYCETEYTRNIDDIFQPFKTYWNSSNGIDSNSEIFWRDSSIRKSLKRNVICLVDTSPEMKQSVKGLKGDITAEELSFCLSLAIVEGMYGDLKNNLLLFNKSRSRILNLKGCSILKEKMCKSRSFIDNINSNENTLTTQSISQGITEILSKRTVTNKQPNTILVLTAHQEIIRNTLNNLKNNIKKLNNMNIILWDITNTADNVPAKEHKGNIITLRGYNPTAINTIMKAGLDALKEFSINIYQDKYMSICDKVLEECDE